MEGFVMCFQFDFLQIQSSKFSTKQGFDCPGTSLLYQSQEYPLSKMDPLRYQLETSC